LKDKDKFSSQAALDLKRCESRKVVSTTQLFALQYGAFYLVVKTRPTPSAARAVWFFFFSLFSLWID